MALDAATPPLTTLNPGRIRMVVDFFGGFLLRCVRPCWHVGVEFVCCWNLSVESACLVSMNI